MNNSFNNPFNNPFGNKKKITIAAASVLAGVLAVTGIAAAVRATTSSTVPVFAVSGLNYGAYMDWENSVSGMVTADAEQNVYLSDTETVEEVLVSEGQAVHKGDVLLKYDTTSTKMKLEKEKINREKIELDIEVAKANLETLNNVSPVSDDEGGFDMLGDFEEFDDKEVYKKATVYVKELKADAKPANDDPENTFLGSEFDPYVFLCDGDTVVITKDFIKKWQKTAKQKKMKQLYFALEKRDKNYNLLKSWMADVMLLDPNYDIEVDLSTGETSYARMTDPEKMAKLIRKVLTEVPRDERAAWFEQLWKKLMPMTKDEDQIAERGEVIAAAINALCAKDTGLEEELAKAAAGLNKETLASLFKNLTGDQIRDVDAEAVGNLLLCILENMTQEQIQALDPEVLQNFLKNLTEEQLLSLDESVISNVLNKLSEEQLRAVLSGLDEDRKELIREILKEQPETEEASSQPDEADPSGTSDSDSGQGGSGTEDGSDDRNSNKDQSGSGDQGGSSGQGEDTENSEYEDQDSAEDTGASGETETGTGEDSSQSSENESSQTENASEAGTPSTAPAPETTRDGGDKSGGSSLLTGDDLTYTSEELEQAKREERDKLKGLELDLRESEIKIRQAERAVESGVVTAGMNGVMKVVGDPASPPTDGSPFLTLAGAEGLFIKSGIKESQLGKINEGDIISVVSWQSGGRFDAQIRSISPYPDSSGMFGDEQNETYYPITASISDETAELTNGDWVEVTFNTGNDQSSGSSSQLTVMKAFIREEGNKKYVFKRGDDGKLVKQYVETGLMTDMGYEILSGLKETDWIAFPYGKNVKEGARTREGDYEDLY